MNNRPSQYIFITTSLVAMSLIFCACASFPRYRIPTTQTSTTDKSQYVTVYRTYGKDSSFFTPVGTAFLEVIP